MSAPSCSSFPPSFTSFPDLDAAGPSKGSGKANISPEPDREKRKKNKKRRTDSREQSRTMKSDCKRKDRSRVGKEQQPLRDEEKPAAHHVEKVSSEPLNRFFYSDRKGDRLNIQYGGLHRGDVPKYRLMGGGRNILGLPNALVVLRRFGKGIEIGLKNRTKISSLTDSAARALLSRPPSRHIFPSSDSGKYQETDGFIRLPSRRGVDVGNSKESYRSIITGHDRDNSDSDTASAHEDISSDDDDDQPVLTAHQETLKQLELELNAKPEAIDTWLSLLNQTLSTIPLTSKNATKARNEISLSILSRALSASPSNSTNKSLRLAYLKAGEDIWHESKVRSEWEEALKIGGIEIQMEWLEWKIKRINQGIDEIVQSAVRALNSFGSDDDSEIAKIRIFWRVAIAVRSAGYSERAMSMFQAQAELIFNAPRNISKMAFHTQLNELEEFWDSEVPRLGEDRAKGWASWYASKEDRHEVTMSQSPQTFRTSDLDPYRQWANQEIQADRNMIISLRSDSDASDPYSIVMFADIRPTLVSVKSRHAKEAFRIVWLSFLGLHVPGCSLASSRDLDWDDRWNLGHLTNPCYLNAIFPSDTIKTKLLTDAVAGVVIGREREYLASFGPVRSWSSNVCGPLDISSISPRKTPNKGIWTSDDVRNVDENIIRRIFTALRMGQDDTEWNTLALAFEAALSPKSAIKLSKTLLSIYPDSIGLWDAHVQLERLRGRFDDARKIYQTILIANKPNQSQLQISLMWWHWAEMEWIAGSDQAALNVILKSVGMEGSHSGITLLRAKRALDDAAGPSTMCKEGESWIKLRALLELLTENDPVAALAIFDKHLTLDHTGSSKESLATASLLLIYYYGAILKKPMPPAILRDRVHPALEAYPSNSIILGILLEAERGQGVWGRVRAMLGANDNKVKDIARRVEEVWIAGWEKDRWLGEVERTRSGLSVAVEQHRTKGSAILWRIYIEFEIRAGDLQRAKKLLFRAIGECPLVKEFYLLAFGPLRSVFHTHELNGLADTMVERGIRLHEGLDEAVGDMAVVDEEHGKEPGSHYESADEIEENARELRRLMPY